MVTCGAVSECLPQPSKAAQSLTCRVKHTTRLERRNGCARGKASVGRGALVPEKAEARGPLGKTLTGGVVPQSITCQNGPMSQKATLPKDKALAQERPSCQRTWLLGSTLSRSSYIRYLTSHPFFSRICNQAWGMLQRVLDLPPVPLQDLQPGMREVAAGKRQVAAGA